MPHSFSIPEPLPEEGYRTLSPRALKTCFVFAALFFSLAGCSADSGNMALDVVGYNHTDESIGGFSVANGGGGFLYAHSGGGGFSCCASIPKKYKPGMTVTVRWDGETVQEKVVPVPPYTPEDGGMLAVHFLRNGEVKVFVTMMGLRHPNYPLKGEEARL